MIDVIHQPSRCSVATAPASLAAGDKLNTAFDPTVTVPMPEMPEVTIAEDAYGACENADVVVVLTEWDDFKWVDLEKVAAVMRHPRVVDARNLLDRGQVRRRGFEYDGIGRH